MGNFDKNTYIHPRIVIKVIGVGGAGCNAVSNLMECEEIKDVDLLWQGENGASASIITHHVKSS